MADSKHLLSQHPWSKTGLFIGVLAGIGLLGQVDSLLKNVHVQDMWKIQNEAAIGGAVIRSERFAKLAKLLPEPGSLVNSTELFSWEPIFGASKYRVLVGTYVGGLNIADVSVGNDTMAIVEGIPQDGQPVHMRLSYFLDGKEEHHDYVYTTLDLTGDESLTATQENPFNPPLKKKK